jgi:hypothetical protein
MALISAPRSPYQWPFDMGIIGLTVAEQSILEAAINLLRRPLPADEKGLCSIRWASTKQFVLFKNGPNKQLPRTVIVSQKFAIILLNNKGGIHHLEGGKLSYDPLNGIFLIKRPIFSSGQQMVINFIAYDLPPNDNEGFSEITHVECGGRTHKSNYYEKRSSFTLPQLYPPIKGSGAPPVLCLEPLVLLQNALRLLHAQIYRSPHMINRTTKSASFIEEDLPCWHGDIRPGSVACELDPLRAGEYRYKWTNWKSAMLQGVVYAPGWGSLEKIHCLRGNPQYEHLKGIEFNRKYGQLGDTWSFALLAGSLLCGDFAYFNGSTSPLPRFAFITDRLKVLPDGRIDDSGLITLTQRDVDDELNAIFNSIQGNSQRDGDLRTWWMIIKAWLKVDASERHTVTSTYIS